jgi:hypothetical protein
MDRGRFFGRPVEKLVRAEFVLWQTGFGQHNAQQGLAICSAFVWTMSALWKVVQDEDLGSRG